MPRGFPARYDQEGTKEMTSTSGTPDATHANTKTTEPPRTVSALLIPANEKQPPRRIDITGLAGYLQVQA